MFHSEEPDVIIVGAGNGALCTAVSALEAGAKVLILEKAPESARGGSTVFTSIYRLAYDEWTDLRVLMPHLPDEEAETIDIEPYATDQFYNDIMRLMGNRAEPAFIEAVVNQSYDAVKWLTECGVKWDLPFERGKRGANGITRFPIIPLRVSGGGAEVVRVLCNLAERKGATILYETKAIELLSDDQGRVSGIRAKGKSGYRDIRAKAVVLATGGFQSSPEMRTKYLGPGWDIVKVRGTRYDTGEGLRMALEMGAATTGEFSGSHACQVFLEGPDYEMDELAFAHGYPFSILVNIQAKRFIDEGEDFDHFTYAKLGRAVLRQPKGMAFQIFDAKSYGPLSDIYGRLYKQAHPITADSLEDLAIQIDLESDSLLATVREFNAAVQEGEYNPWVRDGKGTAGIEPGKTNWAMPLDAPPFYAYPVTCGITFTFGGLKINTEAQVLDTEGNPIPGLYAAGEIVGSFYHNYIAGLACTKGLVMGRIAGRNAAAEQIGKSARG